MLERAVGGILGARWPRYVGERDPEAASGGLVDADFVVAAAQVLHTSMPGRDQSKPGHGLDPRRITVAPMTCFEVHVTGRLPQGVTEAINTRLGKISTCEMPNSTVLNWKRR